MTVITFKPKRKPRALPKRRKRPPVEVDFRGLIECRGVLPCDLANDNSARFSRRPKR